MDLGFGVMILINRILTFLLPLVVFATLESMVKNPNDAIAIAIGGSVAVAGGMMKFGNFRFREGTFWMFLGLVMSVTLLAIFFTIFISSPFLRHALIVLQTALVWLLVELMFRYWYWRNRYQPHALEHLVTYLTIILVFELTSSLVALQYFAQAPFWLTSVLAVAGLAILLILHCAMAHVPETKRVMFVGIGLWLCAQWFVVMNFLPTSNHVIGLAVTVVFYVYANLAQKSFHASLDKAAVRRYVIVGSVVMALALLSAEWF